MNTAALVEWLRIMTPRKLRPWLGSLYKQQRFLNYLKQTFGDRFNCQQHGLLPPPELIETEALMYEEELSWRGAPNWYFGSGCEDARRVLTTAERYGLDLSTLTSILEFGCGSARVLRHFRNISNLRLVGTDANPKPVEWDHENLPGIEFHQNALEPPLDFSDGSFDLIYALSVFTHIPVQWQMAWLQELRRVLRPGGYLLCTVFGNSYISRMLNEQDRAALKRDGAVTLDANNPRASYSTKVLRTLDVFQTREEVRERFGAIFELLCYTDEPSYQDMLVLRKTFGAGTTAIVHN